MRNAKRALALQVVGNLGWMALSCCWMWQNDWVCLDRHFLLPFVLFAFVVFLATSSFFRCADDLGLWNFTAKLVQGFVVAVVASSIVCAGTSLLLWGIQSLFGFDFYHGVYTDVSIFCYSVVAPVVFLQFIPSAESKHNASSQGLNRLLSGVVHYLFLPLLFFYMVVIYAYAAKIVCLRSLPNGLVCAISNSQLPALRKGVCSNGCTD